MAMSQISGHDGSVTLPSNHGAAKVQRFTIASEMTTKATNGYGDGRGMTYRGGKIRVAGEIACLLGKGTTAAPPNMTGMSIGGNTLTLLADTGCGLAGTALFSSVGVQHSDDDPAIPLIYNYVFTGLPSESWVTT